MSVPAQPCPDDDPPAGSVDAAYDILAIASLYAQDPDRWPWDGDRTLAGLLSDARGHGLTVEQLCDATGLDPDYVTRLIEQASTRRAG